MPTFLWVEGIVVGPQPDTVVLALRQNTLKKDFILKRTKPIAINKKIHPIAGKDKKRKLKCPIKCGGDRLEMN